jgi:gamma-glutamylcyclotransferase
MSEETRPDDGAAKAQPVDDPSERPFSCLYFGYASNLSPVTMKQRCPGAFFVGLGVLKGWKWIINETGYANIIPGSEDDEVYGSLCFLPHRDEIALDESEGVPWLYEKVNLKVQRLLSAEELKEYGGIVPEVEALCYVDAQRKTEGKIEREYIVWVNKAIQDAAKCGMPQSYADKYITKYIPTDWAPNPNIMMVRTMRFGDKTAGLVPRGFASWDRG